MLINTPDGWRSIITHKLPEVRHAMTHRELSAKMADEIAELCPSASHVAASESAAMLARTLSRLRA